MSKERHLAESTQKPFLVQILIASDKMDVSNGSTEVVPCSHLMTNVDVAIHDKGSHPIYGLSTLFLFILRCVQGIRADVRQCFAQSR